MGSIPLPALGVKPPDTGTGLDMLKNAYGIQAMQAEAQQRQIALQNAKMQQADNLKLRALYIKHQGDLDKVIADAPQAGVSPQTIQQLQLHSIDAKTKTADLVSKQGAIAVQQADLIAGAHSTVDKAPAEQKPAVYQQQLQALQKQGVDISQMPPQYPGDEQFKLVGAVVQGHKAQVEDAFKSAETAKNAAQAKSDEAGIPAKVAEGKIKQAEADALSQGGMTQSMADSKYRTLAAKVAQKIPISPPDKAFMTAYEKQKTLNATTTFNLQNAGATGSGGQPSAIAKGIADGSIKWNDAVSPRTPMGVKQALLTEVKSINPNFKSSDFEVEKKVQEAFTSGNYSQQLNSINRAREHMQTFLEAAKDLDGGSVKAFNRLSNAFSVEFGSDKVGNLNIAKQAFSSEVGKAFAGSSVAQADREELKHSIDNASSFTQLAGAARTADKLLAGAQKALKKTYDSGMQGQPNFGGESGGKKSDPLGILP